MIVYVKHLLKDIIVEDIKTKESFTYSRNDFVNLFKIYKN